VGYGEFIEWLTSQALAIFVKDVVAMLGTDVYDEGF
jgi:hypothetical protein